MSQEDDYFVHFPYQTEMQCYSHENVYPFNIFPQKRLEKIEFEPITVFYGSNGSGKSTLLNIIAQKLEIEHSSPFNDTAYMPDYLKFCDFKLSFGERAPMGSRIITSDDVFDFLLDIRSMNESADRRREALFDEYIESRKEEFLLRDLKDYEEFKRRNETKRRTKSQYVGRRLPRELCGRSNGESAYIYFTEQIKDNALYLLDEPENSLSPLLQLRLAEFIEDSARFYNCQFIICTHSPFLLAMKDARVYDLDSIPASPRSWTELENVRIYHDFFKKFEKDF